MNPLQARGIQEAGGVSDDHPAIAAERRQRPPSSIGKRLGAVADHLAASEQLANKRMLFEGLQHVLRVEAGVAVVESGDEAEGDYVVVRAIYPRTAVFFCGERITHGVDDFARLDATRRNFPQLLYSHSIGLRVTVFHQVKLLEELLGE